MEKPKPLALGFLAIVGIAGMLLLGQVLKAVVGRADGGPNICLSHLLVNGNAISFYAEDHDGRLPPERSWMDALTTGYVTDSTLKCPLVLNGYGYAFRLGLGGRSLSSLQKSGPGVMVFESTDTRRNAVSTLITLPNPPRHRAVNHLLMTSGDVEFR